MKAQPDMDNENKLYVLDILKFLLSSSGVLFNIAVDKGYDVLQECLAHNENGNPELDSKIIELMAFISKYRPEPSAEDIKKIIDMVKKDKEVDNRDEICLQAAVFFNNEYSKKTGDGASLDGVLSIETMIGAFGKEAMQKEVYNELKPVVKKIFKPSDVEEAVKQIKAGNNLNDNFTILAHLSDTEEVKNLVKSGDFSEIEDMITNMINSDKLGDNFSGLMGFINSLGENDSAFVENMIKKNPAFLKRLIETMESITPSERRLGFSILKSHLTKNSDALLDLGLLEKLKTWISKTENPDHMLMYLDFLLDCAKVDDLRRKVININLLETVLNKNKNSFHMNIKAFERMLKIFDLSLQTENE